MIHPKNSFFCTIVYLSFFGLQFTYGQNDKKQSLWKALNTPAYKDTASDDYYGSTTIRYEDFVYKANIKSVQLKDESFELSQPILNLGSEEKLKLSFDDLNGDLKTYSYTIIQCNANWEPSDLLVSEYIDGFADNAINDYHHSFNTLQKYTHYNAVFPTNATRITKTGNYILKVYQDGNPESLVITKRFMVYESKISIVSRVLQASIIDDRNSKQELDFTIETSGYKINNPFSDLKIVITQNNRWDNAKKDLKPVFVKGNELTYDYDQENVFTAGNEYRNFDIKSIRYHSERISKVEIDSTGNHVTLYSDEKRTFI